MSKKSETAPATETIATAVNDNLVIAGFPHITAFDFAFVSLLALPYLNQGLVRRNPNIYFIATLAVGGSAFGHRFQNRNPEYLDRPADYLIGITACLASVAVLVHHVRENLGS